MCPGQNTGNKRLFLRKGRSALYRETVEKNLESSRKSEKKEGPKVALFSLVLAGLLGLNAYELLAKGRGIVPAFVDVQIAGMLSAALSVLCFAGSVYFLFSAVRNRKEGITGERIDQYLNNVRVIGPEDEVFARVESITPVVCAEGELRYDETLIAGTSSQSVDFNFIYPIGSLCAAGTTRLGSALSLYLHAVSGNRKYKHSISVTEGEAELILGDLAGLRPDLKIERAKPAK